MVAPGPGWRVATVAASAATLGIGAALALGLRQFPFTDATAHTVRYVLLGQWLGGGLPACFDFAWVASPYIGLDLIGGVGSLALPPRALGRAMALLALLSLPVACVLLARSTGRGASLGLLASALVALNAYYLMGFYSYVVGAAAALAWGLAARRLLDRPRVAGVALAVTTLPALFLLHLTAPVLALTFAASALLVRLRERSTRLAAVGAVPAGLALLALAALLGLALPALVGEAELDPAGLAFAKASRALWPFYATSPLQGALGALAFAALLVAHGLRRRAGERPRDPDLAFAALVLLCGYLATPEGVLGGWAVDVRFLLPALAVLGVYLLPPRGGPVHAADAFAAVLALCAAGAVAVASVRANAIVPRIDEALAAVPPGARLVTLTGSELRQPGRLDVFSSYGQWHVVEGPGLVGGVFHADSEAHIGHFRIRCPVFTADVHWREEGVEALDAAELRETADAVLMVGADADERTFLERLGPPLHDAGDVIAVRVAR